MAKTSLDRFFRIGDYVINVDAIAYVDLHVTTWNEYVDGKPAKNDVAIVFPADEPYSGEMMSLHFTGEEADALRWLFSHKAGNYWLGDMTELYRASKLAEGPDHAE